MPDIETANAVARGAGRTGYPPVVRCPHCDVPYDPRYGCANCQDGTLLDDDDSDV